MKSLDQKVAIITGAARGIGAASAKELARAGAHIVVCDLCAAEDARPVLESIEALGRTALFFQLDVSDRAAVERMIAGTIAKLGRIDVLVSNAAINIRKPLLDLDPQDVAKVWDVILWGTFHCTQLVARRMVAQNQPGSIIVISSVHASRPFAGATAYNGAKAALNHMAATWANELADKNIRVNSIEPGWIDTEGERIAFGEEYLADQALKLPMKRLGTPQEIAAMVRFLASDEASYITGSVIRVDGGITLVR